MSRITRRTIIPVNQITPLTYRDGVTYIQLLTELSEYIKSILHPSLQHTVDQLVADVEAQMDKHHDQYVDGVQEFQRIHDAFMSDVNSHLIALNDGAVTDLVSDATSLLGQTLKSTFADKNRTQTATQSHLTIYVDQHGQDTNDGSQHHPLATLDAAVHMIPDVVQRNHVVTVSIGYGVWDEPVWITNKTVLGNLIIEGRTGDRENHKIHRFYANNILGSMTVQDLTTTVSDNSDNSFQFSTCGPHMYVNNVKTEYGPMDNQGVPGSSKAICGVLADYGSTVWVRDSDLSGKRYAIRSNYNSRVFSHNNTGDNNERALGSRFGGIITAYGTRPQANVPFTASSGGFINHGNGSVFGPVDQSENEIGLADYTHVLHSRKILKHWMIRGDTEGVDLPDGILENQKLRLYFTQQNPVQITTSVDVAYMGRNNNYNFYSYAKFTGTAATTLRFEKIHEYGSREQENFGYDYRQVIQPGHSGRSGEFYIDIIPHENVSYGPVGFSGVRWSVNVSIEVNSVYTGVNLVHVEAVPR